MTKREENKLSMYKGVKEILSNNTDVHSSIPVVGEALTSFSGVIDSIDQMNVDFYGSTKGATADKVAKEEQLIDITSKLANVLYVYAVKTKNNALKEDFKLSKSELGQMRDNDLLNKANQIINSAESHQEDLANYGITPEKVTEARTTLNDFSAAFGNQADKMAERSSSRESLTELFDDADAILYDELDPIMELFSDTNTDFYNEYHSARVIRDLGG